MKHGSSVAKLATTRRSVRSRRAVRPRAQSLDPRTEKKFGGGADLPSLRRKLGLRALIATTFFVVSGGPYGLEEIIA
ncbi:MAG TPA: hypothetical protein PK493_07460, partial [Pseudomonadota bacterium]|nr:hypothetical protein [Pseudomonadota bacterium]